MAITLPKRIERASTDTIKRFDGIATAELIDAMGGTGALHFGIRPVFNCDPFVGSAMPVATVPNDNLAAFVAIDVLRPGDVVVISTRNFTGGATIGDTLVNYYHRHGVSAVVLDGLVRDLSQLTAIGIPVYACGVSPNAPQRNGPGTVGRPVNLGGLSIAPGDIIAGDKDGVAIVPRSEVDNVLTAVQKNRVRAATANRSSAPDWLQNYLSGSDVERI